MFLSNKITVLIRFVISLAIEQVLKFDVYGGSIKPLRFILAKITKLRRFNLEPLARIELALARYEGADSPLRRDIGSRSNLDPLLALWSDQDSGLPGIVRSIHRK